MEKNTVQPFLTNDLNTSCEREPGVPFEVKKINPVDDADTWHKMGMLRAKSYVHENNFLDESVLDENGAEFDEYDFDPESSHYVMLDGLGEVIGASRLIYRSRHDHKPLPSEEIFSLDPTQGPAREVSRLITDKSRLSDEYRGSAHYVKLYLMRSMNQETIANPDAGPLYAVIEKPLLKSLRGAGIAMDVVGGPVFTEKYNSENILVEFRSEDITAEMHSLDAERAEAYPFVKERLAPFMETGKATNGVGRVALREDFITPPIEQYERNLGWLSRAEHDRLSESVVAIAGAGGDGGALAVQLARLGVMNFRLADPDPFEVENLNRQEGATYRTIGKNKAEVIADIIKEIQPHANVDLFTDGVTPDNIAKFVEGSDLVIDETEYTMPDIGVMIARESRKNNLPVLMALNVGFGSYVTSFDPNGVSFEKYFGLSEDMPLEEIAKQDVPLSKWIPHIPSYADMNIFGKIAKGEVSAPTAIPGVGIAASHAAVQAIAHLVKDISPARAEYIKFAPRGRSIDIIDGVHDVRYPSLHFGKSALVAYVRTRMKKNVSV